MTATYVHPDVAPEASSIEAPSIATQSTEAPSIDASQPAETVTKTTDRGTAKRRDSFLDLLRAIALTRVIVWHTFGVAVLSWIVATMPIMFFVAGTLLHRSLDGRDVRVVLKKRLRRLLVPFWFFGSIVLTAVSLVHVRRGTEATRLDADQILAWIVPLVNPTASSWEAGWASAPLWYLRCYLWILLLSPLLIKGWKRFGVRMIAGSIGLTLLVQVMADRTTPGPNAPIWLIGDLALYSIFVFLGFANAEGRFDGLTQRDLVEWALIGAAGAAVAWQFFPSADGVANHSYPTLGWLGIAWLSTLTFLRPWLEAATAHRLVAGLVRWMTARAMSIYLWHSPVIVASYAVLAGLGVGPSPMVLLPLVIFGTVAVSTATGWIEDVAGGRKAQLVPGRSAIHFPESLTTGRRSVATRSALGGVATAIILMGLLVQPSSGSRSDAPSSSGSALALPPAPSGRPDPTAAVGGAATPTPAVGSGKVDLVALVDAWRLEHDVAGVTIGVEMPDGSRQLVVSGANPDGSELSADAVVPITSITKTFTAALILQMRDEGLLDLDDPIPALAADPQFAHAGVITYRQLLDHSSGLAPYQDSVGYDATQPLDALTAVRMAGATPLQWEPGTVGGYSNSGFLTLGRLAEQLTGESYEAALQRRFLEPLGLTATSLDTAPVGGWIGDSAGGLTSSVDDLLTWGSALYRDQMVLTPASSNEMMAIDATLASGLGTFPVCPCTDENGRLIPTSLGHNGGSVTMQYSPADDVVIVASFTESFWTNELSQADMYPLLDQIRAAVG